MNVSCPHCKAQYQVADQHFASGDVTLRCPRCKQSFRATASHISQPSIPAATIPPTPAAAAPALAQQVMPAPMPASIPAAGQRPNSVPAAPLQMTAAAPRTQNPQASIPQASVEWDSMMAAQAPGAPAVAAGILDSGNALDDFLPPELQVGLGQQASTNPIPQAAAPRDPFYEANPLVVEQPPADAAGQSAQSYRAQTTSTLPPGPAFTPNTAMTSSVPPQSAMPAATMQAQGSPTTPSFVNNQLAQAQMAAPAANSTTAPASPQRSSTDPFANISLTASAQQAPPGETGEPTLGEPGADNGFAGKPLKTGVAMPSMRSATFPPRASLSPELRQRKKPPRTWPSQVILGLGVISLLLAVIFSLWQFEKLPGEPGLTLKLAKIFGVKSVLQVQEPEALPLLLQRAKNAEDEDTHALAASFYHQALKQDPNNSEAQKGLQRCYQSLGDLRAQRELAHH